MATKSIPNEVKAKVVDIIDRFNRDVLADDYRTYIARFKGNYLFLYRDDGGYKPGPICRLRYTDDMTKWVFAVYRYSTDRYHPDECFFPGDVFYGPEANYEYEFKRKMSDYNYAIKSYRSTWRKLYKYTKSLWFIDDE